MVVLTHHLTRGGWLWDLRSSFFYTWWRSNRRRMEQPREALGRKWCRARWRRVSCPPGLSAPPSCFLSKKEDCDCATQRKPLAQHNCSPLSTSNPDSVSRVAWAECRATDGADNHVAASPSATVAEVRDIHTQGDVRHSSFFYLSLQVPCKPQCLFMWSERWSEREKDLWHSWHLKGFWPVCLR